LTTITPTNIRPGDTITPIPGCEGIYSITPDGRVWSESRHVERGGNLLPVGGEWLKIHVNRAGYPYVRIVVNGKSKIRTLHRLLAETFIPNPDRLPEVRHLNDDKSDYRIENLAWGTRSENALDRVRNGIHPQSNKTHCIHGHEFTPENTQIKRGQRVCITCRREGDAERQRAVRAERKGERAACALCGQEMQAQNIRQHTKRAHFGLNEKEGDK